MSTPTTWAYPTPSTCVQKFAQSVLAALAEYDRSSRARDPRAAAALAVADAALTLAEDPELDGLDRPDSDGLFRTAARLTDLALVAVYHPLKPTAEGEAAAAGLERLALAPQPDIAASLAVVRSVDADLFRVGAYS